MGGKALLILVTGFSLVYLVMGKNFGNITGDAVSNYVGYYNESLSHSIAVSGANMAAHEIFYDPTWSIGYSNISFQNGKLNVQVDTSGNCKIIRAIGSFNGSKDTVTVTLQPSKFSKFAYFSVSEPEGIYWKTSDTVWGPFHTQDFLRISGSPVFSGKTTTKKGISYNKWTSNNPKFLGPYESGVSLPIPDASVEAIESLADQNGKKLTGNDTVYITFAKDSIKYRYSYSAKDSTVLATSFAPNGVIYAKNATLRLKGTVKGKYSVVASGTTGKGRIYIDDDIVYNTNPVLYPNSEDMLGIISKQYVWITKNAANNDNINIHASIFCERGGFGAEDHDGRPKSGSINLLGGIIQKQREAVGTFDAWTGETEHGFDKKYRYDNRFMVDSPPGFPGTNSFEIISWLE